MNERIAPSLLECVAPATSQVIGHVKIASPDEVRSAVERARAAQRGWGALPVATRVERLLAFREKLLEARDELAEALTTECGKPRQEALVTEVAPLAALIGHYGIHAADVLAPRTIPLRLLKHRRSRVHYEPRGVIGIISPWNFPLLIPFGDAFTALFAGNAVVIKPSEHAPLIALKVKELWDASGHDPDLLQIVPGRGDTGQALIESGVQKIVFTGGVETGRRVAASCGRALVECVLELGGKAPALVCEDANLELAARAITFAGFLNAGQACISVERVLAHEAIHDRLVERIVHHAQRLRLGGPEGIWDVGPLIFPQQLETVERLVNDAIERGATVRCGGKRAERTGDFFEPTVLTGCEPDMPVVQEEIFGPAVPILRVRDDEHALQIANSLPLGLNAYVFSKNPDRAQRLAARLEVGSVVINDVVTDYGSPEVPFGGVKNSGYGRVHGTEALRAMSSVKHVSSDRMPAVSALWYPYGERSEETVRRLVGSLFSRRTLLGRVLDRL